MIMMRNGSNVGQDYLDQLNKLMSDYFGFTFDAWYERKAWSDSYESYSIWEDGMMLSHVGAYKMKLLINGERRDCLSIGGVATDEKHRGRGFSRSILEHLFKRYPETPAYLFGNDSVVDFYPKFGFRLSRVCRPYINCMQEKGAPPLIRLKPDDPKIETYLGNRGSFSGVLDCVDACSINLFHLIYECPDNIYEIPGLEALLIMYAEGKTLVIADVVTGKPFPFTELKPFLNLEGIDAIDFGFNPDWLGIDYLTRPCMAEDGNFFVKGDLNVGRDFIIPLMIRT